MEQMIFIALAAFFAVAQSAAAKLYAKENSAVNTLSFNLVKAGAAFLLFGIISAYGFSWHTPTLIYAVLYGMGMLCSMICGYLALMKGPMALTSLIVSYSVVIPCLFGVFYRNEELSTIQIYGLVLLCISILLLRKKDASLVFKKNWFLCVAATFSVNGICSVIQKLHQTAYPGKYCNEFTVYALAAIFAVLLAATVIEKIKNGKKTAAPKEKIKFSALAGVFMGLANYTTLVLSAQENATVLFPLITVCTMILNYATARILFREKLTLIQLGGIAVGITSVVLLKL